MMLSAFVKASGNDSSELLLNSQQKGYWLSNHLPFSVYEKLIKYFEKFT